MTSKSLVVSGEASETDSEDEGVTPQYSSNMKSSMQGAVIAGEDSESENEEKASPKEVVTTKKHSPKRITIEENDSLLHRKLQESNKELCKEIETITNKTISAAGETLNSVEQDLLKSQITLQGALTSLRALNNNSLSIRNKLQEILSSKFLSSVEVIK